MLFILSLGGWNGSEGMRTFNQGKSIRTDDSREA